MLVIHFILGFFLVEGIMYLVFPGAVQNFATNRIMDANHQTLRQWGLFCLVIFVLGFVLLLKQG